MSRTRNAATQRTTIVRHPRGRRQSSATTPTASHSGGRGNRGVMRLRISGTQSRPPATAAPRPRRVPARRPRGTAPARAGRPRRETDRRACTSRCSRMRTRRSRTARRRRGRSPAGSEARRRRDSNVGGGAVGRGLLARRDVLAQRPLAEELPERVGDAAEIDARVLADRLERGVEQHVVVLVRGRARGRRARSAARSRSSSRSAGTRRAGRRGSRAAPSRAPRSSMSAARRRDASPFSGEIVLFGDEDAEERHPRAPAARDGRVVVAEAVVHRPAARAAAPRRRRRRPTRRAAGARRRRRRAARRARAAAAPGSRAGSARAARARRRPRRSARSTADRSARARRSAHSASPVAKTASLEAWW